MNEFVEAAFEPVGVVVADDDPRVRAALAELIDDHPGLHLVAGVGSGADAVELCARHRPGLAIVDVMMPGGGTGAIAEIVATSPHTKVMAFTARGDRRTRDRLLGSGAAAVVTKGSGIDIADALFRLATESYLASDG